MLVFLSMLALGAVVGFVGAGGAGVVIALLHVGFGVPIHTALAVALASMTFTVLSGAVSHYREGEVIVRIGAVMGASGSVGAYLGAAVSNLMDPAFLTKMTGIMLLASASILYTKLYHDQLLSRLFRIPEEPIRGKKLYIFGILTGLVNGFLSGAFGIGAAAFIQLTLLIVFGVPLLQSLGTSMMIILPISASGGLSYLFNDRLDLTIFVETLLGLMLGAYIGSKGTHLAPRPVLKACIVATPTIGSLTLLLFR
ncbi:sulfite exporter TauE/SafE family protein [Selenomonas sp. TAMA-11512]|uniref:sulfite exporter TauE/SafE family protein n=1 Tax=Selenomonas sp. TAMA-11512 TaxID=3095337 RepID=UPI00308C4A67|nr:sulfite exporter TauE/SafE family protein [Selenomonas sp. TAMA-11512]